MYNTDIPRRADLPTSEQLRKTSLIAALSAVFLLVTIVLPSEYAIDPTGVGRLMGLTQMGAIKAQLSAEAANDKAASATGASPAASPAVSDAVLRRLDKIEALLTAPRQEPALSATANVKPAAPEASPAPAVAAAPPVQASSPAVAPAPVQTSAPTAAKGRTDEMRFVLTPGQGVEIKMVMRRGARAGFAWVASGGPVNFDTHGDAPGQSTSYDKGRGVEKDEGVIEAAFDGNHGWFWRNRGRSNVTVTLRTNGDYVEIKKVS